MKLKPKEASYLEFGRAIVVLKDVLSAIDKVMDGGPDIEVKLLAKAYEVVDRNEKAANDYINYQVNYMMEKTSKKGVVPPPFDTWEDSKKYD